MKCVVGLLFLFCLLFTGCSSEKGASFFQDYQEDSRYSDVVFQNAEVALKSERYEPEPTLIFDLNLSMGLLQRDSHTGLEEILPIKKGEFEVEAALFESGFGVVGPSRLIARSEKVKGRVRTGILTLSGLQMKWLELPDADFTRPQASRAKWEIYLRVVPTINPDGLKPAEGYFPFHPGKGSGQIINTVLGTLDEKQSTASPLTHPLSSQALLPSLMAKQIEYRFKGREFSIDKFLNLRQIREYTILLTPHLYYPYVFENGGSVSANLKAGTPVDISLLFASRGVGIQREGNSSRKFLNRYETQAVIDENGQVVFQAPLVIDFQEEPYLDSGIEVFVEMKTVLPGVRSQLVSQLFESRKVMGTGVMSPLPKSLKQMETSLISPTVTTVAFPYETQSAKGVIHKLPFSESLSPYDQLLNELGKGKPKEIFIGDNGEPSQGDSLLGVSMADWRAKLLSGKVISQTASCEKVEEGLLRTRPELFLSISTTQCHSPRQQKRGSLLESHLGTKSKEMLPQDETPSLERYLIQELSFISEVHSPDLPPPIVQDFQWQSSVSFFNEVAEFERQVAAKQEISSWEGGVMGYVNGGGSLEASGGLSVLGTGATAKGFITTGIDARYGWFHRDQTIEIEEMGNMTDRRDRVTISENSQFYGEQRTFSFEATVRHCLYLQPLVAEWESYLICADSREKVNESWFYVADFDFRHEMPVERRDLRERMLIKLIRGTENYRQFKSILTESPRNFRVKQIQPLQFGVTRILRESLLHRNIQHPYFRDRKTHVD